MMSIEILGGIGSILSMLLKAPCLSEKIRILKGKYQYLRAMTEDLKTSKDGETGDDQGLWLSEARQFLNEVECVLKELGQQTGLLVCAKIMKIVDRFIDEMGGLESKGDSFFLLELPDNQQGQNRCDYIPVKQLFGQGASEALEKLEALMYDDKVGRIVIHGVKGIGKTFLMKHLFNCVSKWVDRFDHIFWVTSPDQISIKHLQDAVAAALKCVLPCSDDLGVRAGMIADKLAGLGGCVFFIDDVPETDLSLEEVGVPVPADEGTRCKLVLTTCANLDYRMLDCFVAVELDRLTEDEAYQLFMHECRMNMASISSKCDVSRLLVEKCCGNPLMIKNIATHMSDINDPHEWRNAVFELSCLQGHYFELLPNNRM